MQERRPEIIVKSKDGDDEFRWESVDWNRMSVAHTPKAKQLMARAKAAIDAAIDVPDAIKRLELEGFRCRRG